MSRARSTVAHRQRQVLGPQHLPEDGLAEKGVGAAKVLQPQEGEQLIGNRRLQATATARWEGGGGTRRSDSKGGGLLGEAEGLVIPPHVFVDVDESSCLAQNEIFGPVAPIIRALNEEDALRIANAIEYGLSSAVFSGNTERGVAFARKIDAGMAHVNDQPVNDSPFGPFGGEKNSGIGRFNGRWAVEAFTTDQWVSVQHTPRQYPFALSDLS